MIPFSLSNGGPFRILCVGAHCDDIEIGCGGTILKLAAGGDKLEIYWVVISSDERRKQEAFESAETFLAKFALKKVIVHDFRDGFFPFSVLI